MGLPKLAIIAQLRFFLRRACFWAFDTFLPFRAGIVTRVRVLDRDCKGLRGFLGRERKERNESDEGERAKAGGDSSPHCKRWPAAKTACG